jgi:hypothetical protein
MHNDKPLSKTLPALFVALALGAVPAGVSADWDDEGEHYRKVHREHHHHYRWVPPGHLKRYERTEHHHYYYYDRPYYPETYVRREYYYPRYRNNEFTIIYRGGW